MGTLDVHSDLHELDGMRGPDGLAALGLFVLTGSWTGSHGRTGVVPHDVVQEMSSGDQDAVDHLLRAGGAVVAAYGWPRNTGQTTCDSTFSSGS